MRIALLLILLGLLLSSCYRHRKLLCDEIVLKDGNTQTGTIVTCDSTALKLKKIDESLLTIQWSEIDTIQGKKLKTFFGGVNLGYHSIPYFSVFRNEAITGRALGMQFKMGRAIRGNQLYYFQLSYSPAKPYSITKFGLGYQHYLLGSTYLKTNSFFWGSEVNFMKAQYNNGAQLCLEPFGGFERKVHPLIRLNFKLGLQFNFANKNNQKGVNLSIGAHFLRRNFDRYYQQLNKERRLPKK